MITDVITNTAGAHLYNGSFTRWYAEFDIAAPVITNSVPAGIRSVLMSGKLMGQTIPAKPGVAGVNTPQPYPYPPKYLIFGFEPDPIP